MDCPLVVFNSITTDTKTIYILDKTYLPLLLSIFTIRNVSECIQFFSNRIEIKAEVEANDESVSRGVLFYSKQSDQIEMMSL